MTFNKIGRKIIFRPVATSALFIWLIIFWVIVWLYSIYKKNERDNHNNWFTTWSDAPITMFKIVTALSSLFFWVVVLFSEIFSWKYDKREITPKLAIMIKNVNKKIPKNLNKSNFFSQFKYKISDGSGALSIVKIYPRNMILSLDLNHPFIFSCNFFKTPILSHPYSFKNRSLSSDVVNSTNATVLEICLLKFSS